MRGVPPPIKGSATARSGKSLGPKKDACEGLFAELREHKTPKQGTGTPCEPFVNCDYGPVILLNLLLRSAIARDEFNVKLILDGHALPLICGVGTTG